ncbi:hypothetical protein NDN08_002974 [Rhodosorus marinus]|uniref:Photolyase/cryptochrome alpha/beta domain-containing protein n=1 Tax=Rhodosorus marinus TaxID=101924 RepID=A0AAV8UY00_9RHOD|nr:hypothetical protein NDN08_002974 [Rhodosorus marinus]
MTEEAFVPSVNGDRSGAGSSLAPKKHSLSDGTSKILVVETKHGCSFRTSKMSEHTPKRHLRRENVDQSAKTACPSIGKTGKTLMWFRNDLRLSANKTLQKAVKESSVLLPVFFFDPDLFQADVLEQTRTSPSDVMFLLESVAALREELRKIDSDLYIQRGSPELMIPALVDQFEFSTVVFQKGFSRLDVEAEAALEQVMNERHPSVSLKPVFGNMLFDPDQSPFEVQNCPPLFSDFRDLLEGAGTIEVVSDKVKAIPRLPLLYERSDDLPTVESISGVKYSGENRKQKAGEEAAIAEVTSLLREMQIELQSENVLFGSKYQNQKDDELIPLIKPWLKTGAISPAQIFSLCDEIHPRITESVVYMDLVYAEFSKLSNLRRLAEELAEEEAVGLNTPAEGSKLLATAG